MKKIVLTLALLSSGLAFAQTPPSAPYGPPAPHEARQGVREAAFEFNKQDFAERKADILKRQEERAKMLKTETECINKAQSPAQLHDCHEAANELRREVREHFRAEHSMQKPNFRGERPMPYGEREQPPARP